MTLIQTLFGDDLLVVQQIRLLNTAKLEVFVNGNVDGDDVLFPKHYKTFTADPFQNRGILDKAVVRVSWVIDYPNHALE